jgi:hypothetical protein
LILILSGVGLAPSLGGDADEMVQLQTTHPWGRWQPGSWKRVRVVTESLDQKGRVVGTTTTDTLSFLEEITETDFALRVEVTVDVGGKRFTSQPQSVRQGYLGESPGQSVTRRKLRDEEITISGRVFSVQNRELTIQSEKQRRVTLSQYSDKTPPHVLRSVTTMTNGDGKTPTGSTQVEVVAIDMPYRVLDATRNVSFVRTIHSQAKGSTTITLEAHCPEVPGGVVAHTSKEIDESGQTVKRSTLELLEFGLGDVANVEVMGRRSRAQYRSRGREATPNDRRRR